MVLGLGRTGQATARALVAGGAQVSVWDDGNPAAVDGTALYNPAEHGLAGFDALIMSPGIPLTHPQPHGAVLAAQAAQVPVFGDIELLYRQEPDAPYIAITGTNGKSTVTALTGHLFQAAGLKPGVGGNLGPAALSLVREGKAPYVLELSSYQLDLCQSTRFNAAALLNLSPDHLARHGDFQGYVQAKLRIFDRQQLNDFAFISVDDEASKAVASALSRGGKHQVIPVSALREQPNGISAVDGLLRFGDDPQPLLDLKQCRANLPGRHNWANAAFAAGMARAMGLRRDQIIAGLKTFRGLAHRQEDLGAAGPVRFINDSKATNAEASQWALGAFDDIYWIAGGQAKEGGIDQLLDKLGQVRAVYLIGEAQDDFAKTLRTKAPTGLPVQKCGTLENATRLAYKEASEAGAGTILLSPACASWDQFASFEARGDAFRALADGYISKT